MQSFYDFKAVDIAAFGTFVVMYLAYRVDTKRRHDEQVKMHTENKSKLDSLVTSRDKQLETNDAMKDTVSQLKEQTATLAEMAKGFNRRLEMIEDRNV